MPLPLAHRPNTGQLHCLNPPGQRSRVLVLRGWHLSLPWEPSPIGIIQQQARFKCGHGCFSRHSFPRIFVPGFTISTLIAAWPHHRHVLPFHATLITSRAETESTFVWIFAPGFAGMVHRSVARPPAFRKQLQTALALTTLATFMI